VAGVGLGAVALPVIWRWASGEADPVVVSQTREEVARLVRERGYGMVPEYGKALELTPKQWEQLRDDIASGRLR
jgi:hypothetical protein